MSKVILITGAAGFIGSHLVDFYLNQNYKVIGLDRLDGTASLDRFTTINNWEVLKERFKFIWWDLKSPLNDFISKEICTVDYIIHAGASTHVDRSIENPYLFVMDNVVGTCNILDYARLHPPKKFILISTDEVMGPAPIGVSFKETDFPHPSNPYCLHPDTLVLMADGSERHIKNVNIGDEVISFDFNINEPVIGKVSNKWMFHADNLYETKIRNNKLLSTGQHKLFVKNLQRSESGWINWESPKNNVIIPTLVSELQYGDWLATTRKVIFDKTNNYVYSNPELPRFLGYFISDGYIKYSNHKTGKNKGLIGRYISLADEKREFVSFYQSLMTDNGTIFKHKTKNCWYAQFGDKDLIDALEQYEGLYEKASKKYIPEFIYHGNESVIKKFLGGWFDADGSIGGHTLEICSFSKQLLRQGRLLLLRLGIYSSISENKICISDGKSVGLFVELIPSLKLENKKPYISKSQKTNEGNIVWQPIEEPLNIPYDGLVYDLEIEDYHNFIAEQDIIVHNSASKLGSEALVTGYTCTFKMDALIVRLNNVYGTKQHFEKFIPLVIKKVLLGEKIIIHADATNTISGSRYYIHVKDVCGALDFLIQEPFTDIPKIQKRDNGINGAAWASGLYNGIYNVAGDKEFSNLDLAQMIAKIMNKSFSFELVSYHADRPEHDFRYDISGHKISCLGWRPTIIMEDVLEEIVDWYVSHPIWLGL